MEPFLSDASPPENRVTSALLLYAEQEDLIADYIPNHK